MRKKGNGENRKMKKKGKTGERLGFILVITNMHS